MKIFVTGVSGQLGHDVAEELVLRGHTGAGSARAPMAFAPVPCLPLDITDAGAVRRVLREQSPDAVIHCAAWTDVDGAEDPANYDRVRAVNYLGTKYIAEACAALGCKMLYISTDYVFDGQGSAPWQPDCVNYSPLNVYGQTKLAGELAVAAALEKYFIVRTAWVFGVNGKNFVQTMLRLGQTHASLRVVSDQVGMPTYSRDLARLLVDMAESEKYGFYHATNSGSYISWYDFACEIFREARCPAELFPVSTAEYGLNRAARPHNSRLALDKLSEAGFQPLPPWQDALGRYLRQLGY